MAFGLTSISENTSLAQDGSGITSSQNSLNEGEGTDPVKAKEIFLNMVGIHLLRDLFPRIFDINPTDSQQSQVIATRSLKNSASEVETKQVSNKFTILYKSSGPSNFLQGLEEHVSLPRVFRDLHSVFIFFFGEFYELRVLKEDDSEEIISLESKVSFISTTYNTLVNNKNTFINQNNKVEADLFTSFEESFNYDIVLKIKKIIESKRRVNNTFFNRINLIMLIAVSLIGKYKCNAFLNYKKSLLSLSACMLLGMANQVHKYRSSINTIKDVKKIVESKYINLSLQFNAYASQSSR